METNRIKWFLFDEEGQVFAWAEGDKQYPLAFDFKYAAKIFAERIYDLVDFEAFGSVYIDCAPASWYPNSKNVTGYIPVANGDDIELKRLGE